MEQIVYYTKRLYRHAGNALIVNVLGTVLISLLEGTGIFLLLPMISMSGIIKADQWVSSFPGKLNVLGELPHMLGLPGILLLFIVLVSGQHLLQRVLSVRDASLHQRFLSYLRQEIYRGVIQSDWEFFLRKRKSDLLNVLTSELTRVGAGTGMVLQLATALIFTCIQIGLAFWLSPLMTGFVLFFGLLLMFFSRKFIKKSRSLGRQTSRLSEHFLAGLSDQLNGMKDIKSNNLEQSSLDWFDALTQKLVQEQVDYIRLRSGSQLYYKIAATVLIACFVFVSVTWFQAQMGQLLLIVIIFTRLWPRFTAIQSNLEYISSMIPAFKSVMQLQEECRYTRTSKDAALQKDSRAMEQLDIQEAIECQHVYFRYNRDESAYTLQDIYFRIPSRQTTAIAGRSGAGKSTLIDIVMGLLQPEAGGILIDGAALSGDQVRLLRQSISYVPQDPFLFNASIRENLLMMVPEATEKELWESLEFAASAEFVRMLPQKLDTVIGDRGVRLSGGERQRLVLARAILRKPSILILDEATSALDSENEARIQEALDRLKGKLTMIVIAHRLSTIRNADQIIVLDHGEIIQKGAFHQLANDAEGLFAAFLGNQFPESKFFAVT